MARKFATHIDLQENELRNAVIQVLASDPSSPTEGQIYYNSGSNLLRQYNGVTWTEYGSGGGGAVDSVNGETGVVVLTSDDIDNDSGVTGATITAALDQLDTDLGGKADSSHTHVHTEITDFDTGVQANRLDQMAAPTADVALNSQKITGLATPTASADAATMGYVDGILSASDAMVFQGGIDASGNPNYPAADAGDTYKITVAGKIGGASGVDVTVGDTIYCTSDSTSAGTHAAQGANWTIVQANVDAATETTQGLVELATVTESEAKSDTERAVTPAGLASFTRKYSETIGNGALTSIPVTHSLGSKDVAVQVRDTGDDSLIECDVVMTSTTVVTLGFSVAPASNSLSVTIIG